MITAGNHNVNLELIVLSLDYSGGIKTKLVMITLQLLLKPPRNQDHVFD